MTNLHTFADRADAGRRLAARLLDYRDKNVIVLGIPGSGVPVAAPIAELLHAPLDIALAEPERAESRRSSASSRMRDRASKSGSLFSTSGGWSTDARGARYTDEMGEHAGSHDYSARLPNNLMGRTVILVDDGLHSDDVVHQTLKAIRLAGAQHICLAVPFATKSAVDHHDSECDHIVVLEEASSMAGNTKWYQNAHKPSAEEVEAMLKPEA
jgi:putative phosphoribosyl transferase